MKTISLVLFLSLCLFAGDFFAAEGAGGTGQQNNSRSGAGRSARNGSGQGGILKGSVSVGVPGKTELGAASTGGANTQTIDIRNLNQTDLRDTLQNQIEAGSDRIAFQTNRGVINLTPSQINQLSSDRVLQLLTSLNGTTEVFSGINLANLSDANLRTRLFDLLDSNSIGSQIDVQVRNGVVTLNGFVVTQDEAGQLIQMLSALNLRGLNLQDSDLRLLSDPGNRLLVDTATGQLLVDPQTGVVTNVPVTPNDLTRIGTAVSTSDPRAGSDMTDLLRNFNDPNSSRSANNTANTGIGTGNASANALLNRDLVNDSDLRLAVLDLLDTNGISANNLVIESESGTITLSGFASPLDADRIIQLIRSLNVDQINLNLTLVR